MEYELCNRCLLCSAQILHTREGRREIHNFGEDLFRILEFDGSEFRTETKTKTISSTLLFCRTCDRKMGRMRNTLREFEILRLKLLEFRATLEDDLIQAYNIQNPKPPVFNNDPAELFPEGRSNSLIVLESIVQDLNARKGIALDLFTLTDSNLLEEIKEEAEAYEDMPSPLDMGMEAMDDHFDNFEEMTVIETPIVQKLPLVVESVYIDTSDPRRAALEKKIEIELERIDEIYPLLRSTSRMTLPPPNPSTIREVDDIFYFVSPKDLLDMSNYSFPTRCLAEGCTSRDIFKVKWMLRRHIKRHHIGLPVRVYDPFDVLSYPTKCKENGCSDDTTFSDKTSLVQHMKSVHWLTKEALKRIPVNLDRYRRYPTKCKEEGCTRTAAFRFKYELVRHIRSVHMGKIKDPILGDLTFPCKCPIEGCKSQSVFLERHILKRHLRDVHRPDKRIDPLADFVYPSKCPASDCKQNNKLYSTRDTLRRHFASKHNNLKQQRSDVVSLQCEECGQVCKSKSAFKHHCRIHTGEILVCEDCGSQFRSEGGLKAHRDVHHAPVEPRFPCPLCPKTFKMNIYLKIHLDRHNGVKKIFCQLCPAGFLFKWELRNHQSYNHAEELNLKRAECNICGKFFSKIQVRDDHMVIHTGKGRYNCESCPYTTSRRVDLNEHISTVHSTEFGFECTKCGKRFKLERRLRSHMLTHKDEYDHDCHRCQQRFASARTLRVHMRRKHPDTVDVNFPDESNSRGRSEQDDTSNNGGSEDVEENQNQTESTERAPDIDIEQEDERNEHDMLQLATAVIGL